MRAFVLLIISERFNTLLLRLHLCASTIRASVTERLYDQNFRTFSADLS